MDNIPVEYSERMMVEQLAMTEALQYITHFLIYFFVLIAFVFLIANLIGGVWVRLSERRTSECR